MPGNLRILLELRKIGVTGVSAVKANGSSDAPDLTGRSILIVEDDYHLAAASVAALREAGAEVLGPCATEEASFRQIDRVLPTAAVLDLNLDGVDLGSKSLTSSCARVCLWFF